MIDIYLQKGNTLLHVGALMGHAEIIKLLLRSGAEVNQQSDCHGVSVCDLGTQRSTNSQTVMGLVCVTLNSKVNQQSDCHGVSVCDLELKGQPAIRLPWAKCV